jgi:hypothetical protein
MRATRQLVSLLSLVALTAAVSTARAEGPAPAGSTASPGVVAATEASPPAVRHTLLLSAKLGGLFPLGELGPGPIFQVGAGYAPPVLKGRLALILELGYNQHESTSTLNDPRLAIGTGDYTTKLLQRDLGVFFGPQVFILDPRGRLVPYLAAGVDVHFLSTQVSGDASGVPLGQNTETSTVVGFAARAGFGYRLGPGLLVGELGGAWAPVSQDVTGSSYRGGLSLLIGYTATIGL